MKEEHAELINLTKELQTIAKKYEQLCQKLSKQDPPQQRKLKIEEKKPICEQVQEQIVATTKNAIKTCSIPGCTQKHHAKGFCRKHYRQAKPIAEQPNKSLPEQTKEEVEEIKPKEKNVAESVTVEQATSIVASILKENEEEFNEPSMFTESEKSQADDKKIQTILDQKEEELTDVQKKDLEEHKAALLRLEEMKKRPGDRVFFSSTGQKI